MNCYSLLIEIGPQKIDDLNPLPLFTDGFVIGAEDVFHVSWRAWSCSAEDTFSFSSGSDMEL